jgi:hypothetical protein
MRNLLAATAMFVFWGVASAAVFIMIAFPVLLNVAHVQGVEITELMKWALMCKWIIPCALGGAGRSCGVVDMAKLVSGMSMESAQRRVAATQAELRKSRSYQDLLTCLIDCYSDANDALFEVLRRSNKEPTAKEVINALAEVWRRREKGKFGQNAFSD